MKDLKCISIKHFKHVYNVRTCLEQTLHAKCSKILILLTRLIYVPFCSKKAYSATELQKKIYILKMQYKLTLLSNSTYSICEIIFHTVI